MMSSSRFIRGTKSRFFLYISGISLIGVVIYLYRGIQIHLEDVRKTSEKCQQQQESLSAQLQVVFEYKLRLEKSLHQEKADHLRTKQELQKTYEEEKQLREKENLESSNKFSALQQQHKILKSQHEDLNEECTKVRASQLQSLEEISKLETQLQALQSELRQLQMDKETAQDTLKGRYLDMQVENQRLTKKYNTLTEELSQTKAKLVYLHKENSQLQSEHDQFKRQLEVCQSKCQADANAASLRKSEAENVLPEPAEVKASESKVQSSSPVVPNQQQQDNVLQLPEGHPAVDKSTSKSTTPEINPDAILSQERAGMNAGGGNVVPVPPPQDDGEPAAAAGGQDEAEHQDNGNEKKDAEGEGVGPAPEHHDAHMNDVPQHIPQQPPYIANNGWQNVPPGVVPVPYQNYNGAQQQGVGVHPGMGRVNYDGLREQGQLQGNLPLLMHRRQQQQQQQQQQQLQQQQQHYPGRQMYQPGGGQAAGGVAHQMHNQYPDNADYEKGQKGDIQLEEGEEEDDDDLDQFDYGNDGNAAAKPKHAALYHGLPAMNAGNMMVHQN